MTCSKGFEKNLNKVLDTENLNKPDCELSYQYQECKRYKALITWVLNNSDLDIHQYGHSKESSGFSIGRPDFCKLLLRIFPSGKTENCKTFVSLSVCFKEKLPINSCYQCTISFVNNDGSILKSDEKSGEGNDLNVIDFDCITSKEKLPDFIVNNKLNIRFSLKICCKSFYCKSGESEFSIKESHEEKTPATKMLENMPYTDVVLELKDKEEIKSSKALLASEAATFRILFKAVPEHKQKFKIKDIDASLCKEMLHFIYTGNIWFKSFEHACKIYDVAAFYQIQKLKLFSSAYIGAHLCERNVFLAQTVAQRYKDEELLSCCYNFISKCDTKSLAYSSLLAHKIK